MKVVLNIWHFRIGCIIFCGQELPVFRRVPEQYALLNLIIWYIAKIKSYFVGIGPIRDGELLREYRPRFPPCTSYQR